MSQASGSTGFSRRKIVMQQAGRNNMLNHEEETDVWIDKDVLFEHHLKEVLDKWSKIDDEIWGKIICMQKNRRVAKAYARAPILTVDGSQNGFDGFKIGLAGFENTNQSKDTEEIIKQIGQGVKIKMDHEGNIFIKSLTEGSVFIKPTGDLNSTEHCLSSNLIDSNGELKQNQAAKMFDMKRFTQNIAAELKENTLDRRKLELQCIVNICFESSQKEHLDSSCWVMVINVVALDMLRNKLPEDVYTLPRSRQLRMPQLMENVNATRFLSTPRDEHYPRLARGQRTNSVLDMSALPGNKVDDYQEEYESRYGQPMYTVIPGNYIHPGTQLQLPSGYPAQFRQPLHNYLANQKHFSEMDYRKLQSQPNLHLLTAGQRTTDRLSEWE